MREFLSTSTDYERWRDWKLRGYETVLSDAIIELKNPACLSNAEKATLLQRIRLSNQAIYTFPANLTIGRNELKSFGRQLGLGWHHLPLLFIRKK